MSVTMVCPKCRGQMNAYERNGVLVDQCGDCRGLFLDRGELEHLIDAETAWHRRAEQPVPSQRGYRDHDHKEHGHREHGYKEHGYQPHRKRRSFFEDLFD